MICVSCAASKDPIKPDRSSLFAAKRIIFKGVLFEEEIDNYFVTMFVDFGAFFGQNINHSGTLILVEYCWRHFIRDSTKIKVLYRFSSGLSRFRALVANDGSGHIT